MAEPPDWLDRNVGPRRPIGYGGGEELRRERDHHHRQETILTERCEANYDALQRARKIIEALSDALESAETSQDPLHDAADAALIQEADQFLAALAGEGE